jgi:hypothetical protein
MHRQRHGPVHRAAGGAGGGRGTRPMPLPMHQPPPALCAILPVGAALPSGPAAACASDPSQRVMRGEVHAVCGARTRLPLRRTRCTWHAPYFFPIHRLLDVKAPKTGTRGGRRAARSDDDEGAASRGVGRLMVHDDGTGRSC